MIEPELASALDRLPTTSLRITIIGIRFSASGPCWSRRQRMGWPIGPTHYQQYRVTKTQTRIAPGLGLYAEMVKLLRLQSPGGL